MCIKFSASCMKVFNARYGLIRWQVAEGAIERAERRPDQRRSPVTLHVENRTLCLSQLKMFAAGFDLVVYTLDRHTCHRWRTTWSQFWNHAIPPGLVR